MDVGKRLVELSDGSMVEQDLYGIVERIRLYDPNLRVKYLASHGTVTSAPYAIFELCPDGFERKVFDVWELDERVMQRLYAADNQRNNVLEALETHNVTVQKLQERRFKEEQESDADIIKSALKSQKGRWTFTNKDGKLVQLDDASNGYNGVLDDRQ